MGVLYEICLSWLARESVQRKEGHTRKTKDMCCKRWKGKGTTPLCLYIFLSLPLVSLLSVSVIVSEQGMKEPPHSKAVRLRSEPVGLDILLLLLSLGRR